MKKLVRNGREELAICALGHEIVFTDRDPCGIQVFDTVRGLWLHLEEECVLFVGKLAEDGDRRFNDVLNVGSDLWRAQGYVRFTEYETVMGTPGVEFENFKVANEGRRIDEDIVIRRVVPVAALFQPRIDLPSSWRFEFNVAWDMLLADDIHKGCRWCNVGHLIVQQG